MNKTELLNRYAKDGEERTLLARVLDKLSLCEGRNTPSSTMFLSPGQQQSVCDLLAACGHPRHLLWGGYDGAERKICLFLPSWQEEDVIADDDSPLAALESPIRADSALAHRDILGSLMGLGITREKIGDIFVLDGRVQVVVLADTLPILLSQWESAGRHSISPHVIPLQALAPAAPVIKTIRDTVATLRLDSVVASGFSLSRSKAAALISAGRVNLNHREATKTDRSVAEGDIITCRGMGRCVVKEILGNSRKGRIMLSLERYI